MKTWHVLLTIGILRSADACNNTIELSVGDIFTSPNYPQNYNNNEIQCWHVASAHQYEVINIACTDLCTEAGYDFLRIRNHPDKILATQYSELNGCQNSPPASIILPEMWIEWTSDQSTNNKGFSCLVSIQSICTVSTAPAHILSTNYSANYGKNERKCWYLSANPNQVAVLTCHDFCADQRVDTLKAFSGDTMGSDDNFDSLSSIGQYTSCDGQSLVMISSTRRMYVSWETDSFFEKRGFNCTFSSEDPLLFTSKEIAQTTLPYIQTTSSKKSQTISVKPSIKSTSESTYIDTTPSTKRLISTLTTTISTPSTSISYNTQQNKNDIDRSTFGNNGQQSQKNIFITTELPNIESKNNPTSNETKDKDKGMINIIIIVSCSVAGLLALGLIILILWKHITNLKSRKYGKDGDKKEKTANAKNKNYRLDSYPYINQERNSSLYHTIGDEYYDELEYKQYSNPGYLDIKDKDAVNLTSISTPIPNQISHPHQNRKLPSISEQTSTYEEINQQNIASQQHEQHEDDKLKRTTETKLGDHHYTSLSKQRDHLSGITYERLGIENSGYSTIDYSEPYTMSGYNISIPTNTTHGSEQVTSPLGTSVRGTQTTNQQGAVVQTVMPNQITVEEYRNTRTEGINILPKQDEQFNESTMNNLKSTTSLKQNGKVSAGIPPVENNRTNSQYESLAFYENDEDPHVYSSTNKRNIYQNENVNNLYI